MEYQSTSNFFETIGGDSENTIFYHSTFRRNWQRMLERGLSAGNDLVEYGEGKRIHVYSDLKGVLKAMDIHPDDRDQNRKVFERFIAELPAIDLSHQPDDGVWYSTTTNGIHLRPGRQEGSNRIPDPISLKGENTHAVVAGTTGSGKSVFLNNLILNMMLEYPPWELELYLADFKKVELSRYMNKYETPHVRACAATSEIDYVQSLICYIKDRMDDRQKLFSRLGFTDIEGFRSKYKNVAVPRILFLVDEFQQLFIDANADQKAVIEDLVTNITRLGRAQGVHLLFASQDMSGALGQKQLSNFNVRFALLCDASVSNDILGSNSAVGLKRGQVIAKTKTGREERFSVPIAIDPPEQIDAQEDEYFFRLLKELMTDAEQIGYDYRNTQKFYDEDQQMDLSQLEALLEKPLVKGVRSFAGANGLTESRQNFMSMVLGRSVVYSNAAYDIENIFIDYAKNRCILCLSGNTADLAYFQKLISVNIRTMSTGRGYPIEQANLPFGKPFILDLNPLVSSLYPEEDRLKDLGCLPKDISTYNEEQIDDLKNSYFHYRAEELEILYEEYAFRKRIVEYLRDPEYKNAKDICLAVLRDAIIDAGIRSEQEQDMYLNEMLEMGLDALWDDDSNLLSIAKSDLSFLGGMESDIKDLLTTYYRYKTLKIRPTYKLFPPVLVWITGIENLEKLPRWFPEFASSALDFNFTVMFFCTSGVNYDIKQASNYVFVAGNDPKLYDEYVGRRLSGGNNGIKFYCLVKNTNQKFGFKKYRCQLNEPIRRFIDFDRLFE